MAKVTAIELTCRHCDHVNKLDFQNVINLVKSPSCKKCKKVLLDHFSKPLKGLSPKSYVHELDRKALGALKSVPGVDTLLKTLIQHSFELDGSFSH